MIKKRESETWIYSYADLITNLMTLFIMLLIVFSGTKKNQDDFRKGIEAYTKDTNNFKGYEGSGATKIDDLRQVIADYINRMGLAARVSLARSRTGIDLTFESSMLFETGRAALNEEAETVLANVAALLADMPQTFTIDVEGHADRRPVTGGVYPSNWELSSARAGSVVRFLEEAGVESQRMRAIGFAATRPVDREGDAAINRRVVIKINEEATGDE
jgi:chemotaxis protein MotB